MLVSIQTSIDIANHLIAETSKEKPSTYRESFELLADLDIIDRKLAEELADLAGFRNVLVHMYVKLDLEQDTKPSKTTTTPSGSTRKRSKNSSGNEAHSKEVGPSPSQLRSR